MLLLFAFWFAGGLLRGANAADLVHALGQQFFPALRARMVKLAAAQIIRHALHIGYARFNIMRILVAFAISELLHQWSRRVAQMQRHRLRAIGFDLRRYLSIGGV